MKHSKCDISRQRMFPLQHSMSFQATRYKKDSKMH